MEEEQTVVPVMVCYSCGGMGYVLIDYWIGMDSKQGLRSEECGSCYGSGVDQDLTREEYYDEEEG